MKSLAIKHFVCYLFVLGFQDSIKNMVNKIKIEKFTGKNKFDLRHIKMRALLKEQGIWAPFFGQLLKIDKSTLGLQEEEANSLILLSLSDEVLYKVFEELTVVGLWLKLEKFFMMKSICNK